MRFFGFADCCGLRKWTNFQHCFRLYLIFVAIFRFSKNMRFADIHFLIVSWGLLVFTPLSRLALCAGEMQRTINEARANEQCTIDIFPYVQSISFNIRLFAWFMTLFLTFVHSKQTKSDVILLLRLTSLVFENCERETLQDVDKILILFYSKKLANSSEYIHKRNACSISTIWEIHNAKSKNLQKKMRK